MLFVRLLRTQRQWEEGHEMEPVALHFLGHVWLDLEIAQQLAERRFLGLIRPLPAEPLYVDPPEAKLPGGRTP